MKERVLALIRRVGHYHERLMLVVMALVVAQVVVPAIIPRGTTRNVTATVLSWTMLAVFLFVWRAGKRHDKSMCPRCADDFPLDPAADAARYRRSLRAAHWLADHPYRTLGLFALGVVLLLTVSLVVRTPVVTGAAYVTLMAWVFGTGGVSGVVVRRHSRLQLWCPYCDRGDEDDDEVPEAPDGPEDHTVDEDVRTRRRASRVVTA